MHKFLIGTALGAILSFVFVRFGLEPPAITKLPDKLKANVVATMVEGDLYDLAAEAGVQERALKVYFANRAGDAAKLDAAAGHPFLTALHRARAKREAAQLTALWQAYDTALAEPALRATLETTAPRTARPFAISCSRFQPCRSRHLHHFTRSDYSAYRTTMRQFEKSFAAAPADIDERGHVNNALWVRRVQDLATAQ